MKFPLSAVVIALIVYIGFFGGVLLSGWLLNWLVPAVEFNTALIIASVALLCLVLGVIQGLTLILFANIQFLRSLLVDDPDDDIEDFEDFDEEDFDEEDFDEEDFDEEDDEDEDEDGDGDGDDEEEGYGTGRGLPPLESRQLRRQRRRSKRRRRR